MLLTESGPSAHALRTFMRLHAGDGADTSSRRQECSLGAGTTLDSSAVMLKCSIGSGRVGKGCVLVNVAAPSVDVDDVILMNVSSTVPITGRGGLLYNVVHTTAEGELDASAVRADVFAPGGGHLQMRSERSIDGGKAWKQTLEGNPLSFEGVYKANQVLNVGECAEVAAAAHAAARAKLPPRA